MDLQDQLLRANDASGTPSTASVSEVIKLLKETAYLSQFLDRLTQDTHAVEDTPVDAPEDDQLEALQSDEEVWELMCSEVCQSITSGIEQLLNSIKSGRPVRPDPTPSTTGASSRLT